MIFRCRAPGLQYPLRTIFLRHNGRSLKLLRGRCLRLQSTTAANARSSAGGSMMRVFVAPRSTTILYGLSRVLTPALFLIGTCFYAPFAFFDPNASNWMVPVYIVGSALPMCMTLLFPPYVSAISLQIPNTARRSEAAMAKFVSRLGPDTQLHFMFMRFRPWPHLQAYRYSDLARIPTKRWLTDFAPNIEHVPKAETALQRPGILGWFARKYWCQYWVPVAQNTLDEPGPEVLAALWRGIPMKATREARIVDEQKTRGEKRARKEADEAARVMQRKASGIVPVRPGDASSRVSKEKARPPPARERSK